MAAQPGSNASPPSAHDSPPRVHWVQRFMDNPWLLLALGILIPFISYTAWGWIEILMMPAAKLP